MALAVAAVGLHGAHDKVCVSRRLRVVVFTFSLQLPIYPVPEPEVVLVETPSELEKQISVARSAVTATYDDAHSRIQAVVSRWIGVEQAVERTSSLPSFPFLP